MKNRRNKSVVPYRPKKFDSIQVRVHDDSRILIPKGEKCLIINSFDKGIDLKRKLNDDLKIKIPRTYEAFVKESNTDCPSDIIKRGKKKINKYEYSDYFLKFNGKNIGDNQNLSDHRITNLDRIDIEIPNIVAGAGGFMNGLIRFADVTKENTKEIFFTNDAPEYRICKNGLNLFGKCSNKSCKSSGNEVIVPIGDNLEYDLKTEINLGKIRCPLCDQIVIVNTCGFCACSYNFEGRILKEDSVQKFKSKTLEAPNDRIKYYVPDEKEMGEWLDMKIYVLKEQSKPFKETTYFT